MRMKIREAVAFLLLILGLPVQMHYDNYVDFTKTINTQEAVAEVLLALTIMEEGCGGLRKCGGVIPP